MMQLPSRAGNRGSIPRGIINCKINRLGIICLAFFIVENSISNPISNP